VSAFSANVIVADKDIVQSKTDFDNTARMDEHTPITDNIIPSKRSIINLQNQLMKPI
jgi:hypothetical protein